MSGSFVPPLLVESGERGDYVKLAKAYLGTEECFVWVGFGFDTPDNDDQRVAETRQLMARWYPHVPYGMFLGNPGADGFLNEPLIDELADGYYVLRLDLWPAGVYRFNYHGPRDVASPFGSPRSGARDGEVSWAWWGPDRVGPEPSNLVRPFVHRERNGAGYCFCMLIDRDRKVHPFGNLDAPWAT